MICSFLLYSIIHVFDLAPTITPRLISVAIVNMDITSKLEIKSSGFSNISGKVLMEGCRPFRKPIA